MARKSWTIITRDVGDARSIRRQFKTWLAEYVRSVNPLVEYEAVFAELVALVVRYGNLPSCIEANVHGTQLQLSVDDWGEHQARDGATDLYVVTMLASRVTTHVQPFGRRLVVVSMPILA